MDLKDIRELVKLLDKSSVTQLKLEQDGTKISISKHNEVQMVAAPQMAHAPVAQQASNVAPSAAPVAESSTATQPSNDNYIEVKSPMVGTYYAAASPDAEDFVKVGDDVSVGQVMCIVEAMKIMNELQAEAGGKVAKILVKNGEPVEFNQVLFLLEK